MVTQADGFCESMDPDEDDAIVELFSDVFERMCARRRILDICNIIFKGYCCRYDADFPEELKRKISSINYYPALEEVCYAIGKSVSPVVFERQVDSIIEKYADEISARNQKEK